MELQEIRYFLALTRTLNFTRAAEQCNVSQPALTRAIQKMEDELGGVLFARERNRTHLTNLGRLLEPHLTEVMANTQKARETATRFLRLESAHISLGVMCTIGPLRFVSFLSRFHAENPGVDVTLLEGVPDRLCELLLDGKLDVALVARPEGFTAPLQTFPLYTERFVIACAAGHPFARQNSVRVAELDGQPYLARINCEYFDHLRATCHSQGARMAGAFRSEREDWIQIMVAAGMGISFIPEFSATVPGVVIRPVISPTTAREVSVVTVAGRRWSSPLSSFVHAVRQYSWPASPAMDDEDTC